MITSSILYSLSSLSFTLWVETQFGVTSDTGKKWPPQPVKIRKSGKLAFRTQSLGGQLSPQHPFLKFKCALLSTAAKANGTCDHPRPTKQRNVQSACPVLKVVFHTSPTNYPSQDDSWATNCSRNLAWLESVVDAASQLVTTCWYFDSKSCEAAPSAGPLGRLTGWRQT